MEYVVCLAKRTFPKVVKNDEDISHERAPSVRCQYINCEDISEAESIADKLGYSIKNTEITIGVRVWNGKGHTFVPLATIVQVYGEMARNARVAG